MTTIALVFSVINFSTDAGSMVKVSRSMSANWRDTRFQWSRPCFNAGSFLEKLVETNTNLTILLNTRALRFNQVYKTGKVISIKLVIGRDHACELKAKIYVLAAGGIETPRILINSDDLEEDGFGNRSGALGRYFSTLHKGHVGTLHTTKPVRLNAPIFVDTKQDGLNLRFGLGRNLDKSVEPLFMCFPLVYWFCLIDYDI